MSLSSTLRTLFTLGRGLARGLPEAAADRDPIDLFQDWYGAATRAGILLPESMTLATADADARPSARMVLLKSCTPEGFVFYTNYASRKAADLAANPRAALVFHWAVLQRQVRVEGSVERVSEKTSAAYFQSRPRGSRIGAWASRQSHPLAERRILEKRLDRYQRRFAGAEVPLPPFWGGYRLVPEQIEFWQGRADRLHDRLLFSRMADGWEAQRLYP
jgi:pyridoxamine 5'-phosphate oxidase